MQTLQEVKYGIRKRAGRARVETTSNGFARKQSELRPVAANVIARIHPVITYASLGIIRKRPPSVLYIFRVYHKVRRTCKFTGVARIFISNEGNDYARARARKNFRVMDIHGRPLSTTRLFE